MANMYRSVLSGGGPAPTGDAVAADVLSGKTFSNASATGISGTMVNNGAVSGQATPSQPYTIPAGYHNGSGQVTASGVDFIAEDYYFKFGDNSITAITSEAISVPTNTCVIANIRNKNTVTFNSGSINLKACNNNMDSLTNLTVTGNTPIDISSYDYIIVLSNANANMTIA